MNYLDGKHLGILTLTSEEYIICSSFIIETRHIALARWEEVGPLNILKNRNSLCYIDCGKIASWVHHEGTIRQPIAPWANTLPCSYISLLTMRAGRKEMFYLAREETRYRHMGYSFWLAARVLLYAPSHRQDSTYHGLWCTSRGALAGTRNSSMGPPWRIDLTIHRTMSEQGFFYMHHPMDRMANTLLHQSCTKRDAQRVEEKFSLEFCYTAIHTEHSICDD